MPEFFYLLINYPPLIAAPIILFGASCITEPLAHRVVGDGRVGPVTSDTKLGMHAGALCSGEDECMKRTPLYFVYPLLASISVVALVQVYVRFRDRRRRERLPGPRNASR